MDSECCEEEGGLVRDIGERERRKQGIAQGKLFPKTTDWEKEKGWILQVFMNSGVQTLKFWRSAPSPELHLVVLAMFHWGRRAEGDPRSGSMV